jgi:hypothetical protein
LGNWETFLVENPNLWVGDEKFGVGTKVTSVQGTQKASPVSARERAPAVAAVITTSFGIGLAQRALSVSRLTAAIPRTYGRWPLGRAAALWPIQFLTMKTTVDVVPSRGGPWNLWGKAFVASQSLKAVEIPLTVGLAATSGYAALKAGGPQALIDTRQGRTGAIATAVCSAHLYFLSRAAREAPRTGAMAWLGGTLGAEMLGKYKVVAPALVGFMTIALNEAGYLDFLNHDEHRSLMKIGVDANDTVEGWLRHPTTFYSPHH